MERNKWDRVKQVVIPLLAVLLLFLVFFAEINHRIPAYRYSDGNEGNNTPVGEITDGTQVVQELPCERGIIGYSVLFATYARENSGHITIQVRGKTSGNVYALRSYAASEFTDNSYVDLLFDDASVSEQDQVLELTVTADSRPSQALTIWATGDDTIPDCALTVGGVLQKGDLCIKSIQGDSSVRTFAIIVLSFLLILAAGAVFWLGKERKIETTYAVLAFSLGLLYLFVMTPLSIPDELYHYQSAYRLSNVLTFHWDEPEYGDAADFDYSRLAGHYNVADAYERLMEEIAAPGIAGESVEIPQPCSLGYPLDCLPQAFGIALARLTGANFLITFYLGRLCNLLFYIACAYLAIRAVPRYKLLFAVLGIAPMALHQAASYSYDGFINGMALLLIALILRSIYTDGAFTKKEFWAISITGLLLAPAKLVYCPLLLLIVLIPKERFRGTRHKARTLVLMLCLILVPFCLLELKTIVGMAVPSGEALNWEGGHNYTTAFILRHPGETIAIFLRTFYGSAVSWFEQSIGSVLSGLSLFLPAWMTWCYVMVIAASALEPAGDVPGIRTRERVVFLAVSFVVASLIMLSMFLVWTSDTRRVIQGVQGRYFIPILPLLFLSLNRKKLQIHQSIERGVLLSALFLNAAVIHYVLRYTIGF